jgi:hypothetical protein
LLSGSPLSCASATASSSGQGRGGAPTTSVASAGRCGLLDAHPRDGAGDDEPLDLRGPFEDRVASFLCIEPFVYILSPATSYARVRTDASLYAGL